MNDDKKTRWDIQNPSDIEKIRKRIVYAHTKIAGPCGADDCAQEILTRMLEGKHQHSTIDQAVIDYLRGARGDKRLRSHSQRKAFGNADSYEQGEYDHSIGVDLGDDLGSRIDRDRIVSNFRGWQRCLMLMRYRDGLNAKEVADYFGFTESWVCLWDKRLQGRIQARIDSEERARVSRTTESEVARLLPEETKGFWGRLEQATAEGMERCESWSVESIDAASF